MHYEASPDHVIIAECVPVKAGAADPRQAPVCSMTDCLGFPGGSRCAQAASSPGTALVRSL